MNPLKVLSYNVKGLHNPIKRKKVLNQLKQYKCQIAFLQETHLSDTEHEKLKKSWADKVFFSSHKSGKKRGVAILIHRQINFKLDLVHKDSEGRYILLNGTIDGVQISLVNVYAPNEDDPEFIKTIFDTTLKYSTGILLKGGDYNCVMSQYKDKHPIPKTPPSRMSKMLKHLSSETGLIDTWRNKFPGAKDFSFFSARHSSYSRIDMFFTPEAEVHRIVDATIFPITISDHAPISVDWDIGYRRTTKQWRLNASLLNDRDFVKFVNCELHKYLEINTSEETSPLILWDCAKAYMRGCIISYASARKKRREKKQRQLEDKIGALEQQHKRTPNLNILNTLKQARRDLNTHLSEKIEGNLRFTNQKYYEYGNRASRLLALRLKKQQSSNIVQKVISEGVTYTKPDEISNSFADFYKTLYKNTDTCTDNEELEHFLEKIKLPELLEYTSEKLDRPITEEEILQVISTLKNNKSPGPDGFINEFYKTFKETVSPLLLRAYHHALESGEMAPSWRDATIIVIHKEGKDPTKCQSYRPISLLNTDLRILTAILARRVNECIDYIIHPDQTGFITGRYYGDNIRRLLNVMVHPTMKKQEAMLLALDAQKAFDRVSWPYLIQTLKKFKFGPNFIKWIQTLYSGPQASVKVNGFLSNRFTLERGCRQGCSLSPLLFAISIEPLAQWIRDDSNIKGLTADGEQHKLSLYADDVLLYLLEPATTIPHLKSLISEFGYYSGYKINVDKTVAMDISGKIPQTVKTQSGFKWTMDGFKYLGIFIPLSLDKLYETNYKQLIQTIGEDLNRWSVLPLSLLGRIESIRMNVLPRLLYPFQMLPVDIPKDIFDKLDKLISKFIWQGRRPRVRLKTLQLSKEGGGLKLPNLRYYFWAAQLKPLTTWLQEVGATRWLNLEQSLCSQPLQVVPFLDAPLKETQMNEWTRATVKIWRKIKTTFGLPKRISSLTNIGYMREFIPARLDAGFRNWSNYGLASVYQLLNADGFKSFEQLQTQFDLPRTNFYRYLQLRDFLTKHLDWAKASKSNPIEDLLIKFETGDLGEGKVIRDFYQVLLDLCPNNTLYIKEKWETELGVEITLDSWEEICSEAHFVTNSNTWREFKWKVVSRFFRTPHIVSKMGPNHSDRCWRGCGAHIGTHSHIFWTCPKLQPFWKAISGALGEVFGLKIPEDPKIMLLGEVPAGLEGRPKIYLLHVLLTAAIKCITIKWLKPEPPTYTMWREKNWDIYQMEEITYALRLQPKIFIKRWAPMAPLLARH